MDTKLTVQPAMVTFSAPLTERQVVDLDIKNDWNKAIIFKMKTTRPEAFKMKPVYGLIDAGDKKKVILTLKKWDPNKKPKKSDHFTVVMAPAPAKCNNPMKTWKSWKESKRSETSIGACRRVIKITYKGIAVKEGKKKSSKTEVTNVPAIGAEQAEDKVEKKIEGAKEDEAEKKPKWKPKKKEEEEGEEEEKVEKKGAKDKKKEEEEEEEEDEEEEEEEEEEEDEKPKKKSKKGKKEEEQAKKKDVEDEDGKGEKEDEGDKDNEEE
ncbi:MSP (Major sperm protein) domain family protein [Acanthocheilonema viteae]|uniref:Major sperm protein n=1 Tax=Acanthocheilonema viteae TaxID=6277 RepID=A0A498SCI6_ACAVI|nr:unnamed protein product [Acanthocheilonema viteae]